MAIEKKRIPPSINFEKPNPNIPFSDLGIKASLASKTCKGSNSYVYPRLIKTCDNLGIDRFPGMAGIQ